MVNKIKKMVWDVENANMDGLKQFLIDSLSSIHVPSIPFPPSDPRSRLRFPPILDTNPLSGPVNMEDEKSGNEREEGGNENGNGNENQCESKADEGGDETTNIVRLGSNIWNTGCNLSSMREESNMGNLSIVIWDNLLINMNRDKKNGMEEEECGTRKRGPGTL